MQLTSGQTNLIILVVSIALVYYFYPEYINIITPLFIAITLYFSNNDTILSMFNNEMMKAPFISDFIIKYKTYIVVALTIIGFYFTNELLKSNNKEVSSDVSTDSSDLLLNDSAYSSTKLLPKKSLNKRITRSASASDLTLPSSSSSLMSSSESSSTRLKTKMPQLSDDGDLFNFN